MIEFKPTEKYADIFTKRFECDDYACMAHPNGCFFCEHLDDVFWDYTHGPYKFFCDQGISEEDIKEKGLLGQCKYYSTHQNRP